MSSSGDEPVGDFFPRDDSNTRVNATCFDFILSEDEVSQIFPKINTKVPKTEDPYRSIGNKSLQQKIGVRIAYAQQLRAERKTNASALSEIPDSPQPYYTSKGRKGRGRKGTVTRSIFNTT